MISLFSGFIACGADNYQADLKEDIVLTAQAGSDSNDYYGIHAREGWINLPIPMNFGENIPEKNREQLKKAIQTWELSVGRSLFSFEGTHAGVTGDSFPDLYSSLSDDFNSQYFDFNWDKTGKNKAVLGTTIWSTPFNTTNKIVTADIRYNLQEYLMGDALVDYSSESKIIVDLQSLATHEFGHLLGLAHVTEDVDEYSLMNPSLFIGEGLTTRIPSEGDVRRIQQIYGCIGDSCDIEATIEKIKEMHESDLDKDSGDGSNDS